ncbi:hypothetical protein V5O48_005801 [Marasmius crinis-equi]|uniref:DUF7330 domain-containing protein n=1 Tax=Marasmius crinis-equi TaxID=585013 RepID=A0ABR3FL87_9AGAR
MSSIVSKEKVEEPRRIPFLHRDFEKASIKEKVALDPLLPVSKDLADSAARCFWSAENEGKRGKKVELVYLWTGNGNIDLTMQVEEHSTFVKPVSYADVMPSVTVRSREGNISVTLEDSPETSLPIDFEIDAADGDVFLYIPRNTNSMIKIQTPGAVVFSDKLQSDTESPVENDNERRYFLGEWEQPKNFLFMVRAPAHGTVFLQYEGERAPMKKLMAARLRRLFRSLLRGE